MQITADHAQRWAAKFERYDRHRLFELLDSSFLQYAPKWTARRKSAEELLLLVQLPHDFPELLDGQVRALSTALRLGKWMQEWSAERVETPEPELKLLVKAG